MPSRIIAAAIMKGGRIFVGSRHHIIINCADPPGSLRGGEQGFITDTGEFVNRRDAADIAYFCGQIEKPKLTLFSEDLWESE